MSFNQYQGKIVEPCLCCSPLYSNSATLRAFASVPAQPGLITGNAIVCPSVSFRYIALQLVPQVTYHIPGQFRLDGL